MCWTWSLNWVPMSSKLFLEFYSNMTKGMGDPISTDFQKVFVRGHHFDLDTKGS